MTDDITYDLTIKRYDEEFSRSQHLDSKAGTQIGFSGIIISILSFAIASLEYDQIITNPYLPLLGWGLAIILISIGFGITALTKFKKTLPIFKPEKFYDKYDETPDAEKRKQALLAYFDLIYDFEDVNNRKAKILYAGNLATILGLLISFISFLFIFKILG